MNEIERARQLVLDDHLSLQEASAKVVADMTRAELEADRVAALVRALGSDLRRMARLATTSPEQLQLFEMARSVPGIIRCLIDGEEMFLHWQDATPEQVEKHYAWREAEVRRELGIIERGRGHWTLFEGPGDIPVGQQLFASTLCSICGLPWRKGDPYERAHDEPVGDGQHDQIMRWAHRKCNRSEGTGGREAA